MRVFDDYVSKYPIDFSAIKSWWEANKDSFGGVIVEIHTKDTDGDLYSQLMRDANGDDRSSDD